MGKGANVQIQNLSQEELNISYSDINCVFQNGDEGSNFAYISGKILPNKNFPVSETQYIEAKASGTCAFQTSTFTMNIQGSQGSLSAKFSESSNTWRVENKTITGAGLRADIEVYESGDRYNIDVRVSDPWSSQNWMADTAFAIKNTQLKDLVLPGTHDSGTYGVSATSTLAPEQDIPQWVNAVYGLGITGLAVMEVIARWAKTQSFTIAQQLNAGIRYLDLRVVKSDSEYYICHSLYSINVNEVISDVKNFIEQNPQEIIILDFNHFYAMPGLDDHSPLIEKLIAAFGNKMAPYGAMSPNSTVNDFWQKGYQLISLYDRGDCVNAYSQLWSYDYMESPWPETTDINDLKSKLDKYISNRSSNKLFVLQGILTPDGSMIAKGFIPFTNDPSSNEALAHQVTPQVVKWLQEWSNKNMNIIIVDWFEITNYVACIRQINVQKAYGSNAKK